MIPERLTSALQMLQDTDLEALLKWAGDRPRTSASSNAPTASEQEIESPSAHPTILQSLKRAVSPPATASGSAIPPLTISLQGLSAFPDARKATVLHAKPHDSSDRLYYFCLAIRQNFINAGFMQAEERPLILHATLVNTVYSRSGQDRKRKSGRGTGRITVDARELMRRFNGRNAEEDEKVRREEVLPFVWAEGVEIDRARICKMGAKKVEDVDLGMDYEVVRENMVFLKS